jgi:copper chaperone CopZ
MTCGHCKMAVEKILKNISGVESVDVDLGKGEATVILAENIDETKLVNEINASGIYSAQIKN